MEDLKKLVEKMYKEMEADLARSGDLEEYGEDGIRESWRSLNELLSIWSLDQLEAAR